MTCRSAGATLRRYNEAALVQEIQELISSWSQHVEEASVIFIRTPKYSRGMFVSDSYKPGGRVPFSKDDPRLRNIPFATRRPTLKEVQNVHSKLAAIYVNIDSHSESNYHKSPKPKQREKADKLKLDNESTNNVVDEVQVIVDEGQDEFVVNEQAVEVENELSGNENGPNEKVSKKKKKKKGKKTTSEGQSILHSSNLTSVIIKHFKLQKFLKTFNFC